MMKDRNVNNSAVIDQYIAAISSGDVEQMRNLSHPGIQYFDPLFGGVEGENVIMLKLYESSFPGFSLEPGSAVDLDDGYYTCSWLKHYTYPVTGKQVKVNGKSHIRIQEGLVTGYSEAFSLHRWAKDAYGIAGWFFGSIFFFQRKMRREAAAKFIEFVS